MVKIKQNFDFFKSKNNRFLVMVLHFRNILMTICFCLLFLIAKSTPVYSTKGEKLKIKYIDQYFENASPLNWEMQGDTIVKISLIADYERNTLNRQTDHWYFRLVADKGTHVKLILSKITADVYNGNPATNWWNFVNDISCYISYDLKRWDPISTSRLPGMELMVDFMMQEESVYIARMPPYTLSDLETLKTRIGNNSLVKILDIGHTVEKRPLEIIQLGNEMAANSIIIRARAHPWEAGGNWVVEGLINKFISQNSKKWQETFCIYIMPMANKDGVERGMTRFNVAGKDLNRNWDEMADSILCPEKYFFEKFIEGLVRKGITPCLGIDIHNDDAGGIILARHPADDNQFIEKMKMLEKLMREHTSFSEEFRYSWDTEGQSDKHVSFENGLFHRYGIEALVYELNANWIGRLHKMPTQFDWMMVGEDLNEVFYEFLKRSGK